MLSFRTSADLDGVERLSIMAPDSAFLSSPYEELPHLDDRSHALSLYFVVKFKMTVAALSMFVPVGHRCGHCHIASGTSTPICY